jgi:hypothetical protein
MTMTEHTAYRLRRLASPRRPPATGRVRTAAALLLRLGCAALLVWIGYIHLHLWLEGYRHIPVNGPLFLLDAIAGFALAAVLLACPRPLAGLLAAGYTAATLGALLISLGVGLFGFRESISASYVTETLVIETITVLALLGWTVLVTAIPRRPAPARGRPLDRCTTARPANPPGAATPTRAGSPVRSERRNRRARLHRPPITGGPPHAQQPKRHP